MMQPAGPSTRVKIEFAQASDPGRDPNKQVNEDACGYAETKLGHVAVLCDGMGGHYGGKEASRTAIATIFELIDQAPTGMPPSTALKLAIEEAGRRVYRLGGPPENRTRPGSTVVAMVLHDRGVDVAHVGDSRAYVVRSSQIYPLTRDHSMVQGMIDAGMLTEQQAIGHPDANKITRALGMKPEVEVEVRPEPMELYAGDVLLMASDGLTDLALGADILGCTRQALASGSVDHACKMLVQMANDRGGHDNITVQMARVLETGGRPLTIPEGPGGAQETVAMTRPEADAGKALAGAGAAPHPGPTAPWGAVPPTAPPTLLGPGPGATAPDGASPTQVGQARPTEPGDPLTAAMQPVPGMGAYRADGSPGALPLPPPATAAYVAAAAPRSVDLQTRSPDPRLSPAAGPAGYPPHDARFGYSSPSMSVSNARPSRGGIVFVVIGLSAVIAVLLVVLLWALLPR